MKTYKTTVPPTLEMGSYSSTFTGTKAQAKENALWDYNSARAHDGLEPLAKLPRETKIEQVFTKTISGREKFLLGKRKDDGASIFMTKPSFDCGWYWSFGYLGNKDEHYHLSGYSQKSHYFQLKDGTYKHITEDRNKNMYDCLLEDYDLEPQVKDNLWSFCEQASTIYNLKEIAEIFNRGGSHFTTHPLQSMIKGFDKSAIVNELLPALLQKFWDDFSEDLK